jgi:hypothetical protein
MSIQTAKEKLIERITSVTETSTSLEDMSYAAAGLAKLAETQDVIVDPDVYTIGTAGTFGFGVGALRSNEIPTGWTALPGHDDPVSPNYGNYLDPLGSHMVFIPRFWYNWSGNTPLVSKAPATGYVLHEAFRFASRGFFRDKTHMGNVGGLPLAKIGIAPVSTNTSNNPIGALTGAPANTSLGMVGVPKLRTDDHHLETIFESNALAILALAHSVASTNTAVCAYKDVSPYLPKGNNNNALRDTDDSNVQFVTAGNATYPACALTGSGFPFAKTTHNGQACGVADVNGNMYRANIGLTKLNNTDGIFKILKTTVNPNTITETNIHDAALYDDLDLTVLIPSAVGNATDFGNATERVFDFSTSIDVIAQRAAAAGIPLATGVSSTGTSTFGNDSFYRAWVNNLLPIVGGDWNDVSYAGVFTRYVNNPSSGSHHTVGGSACVTL